jgi:hypothetical protein
MSLEFLGELEEIFAGAQAGLSHRWSACNFFDKVILAQSSVPVQYWPGGGKARPLPGLSTNEYWDGVTALFGHLMLWRGNVFKWSDVNDFSMWIPVGETATTARATLASSFVQPGPGLLTSFLDLVEKDRTFTVGQYVRIELNADDPQTAVYNFYLVTAITEVNGEDVVQIQLQALDLTGQSPAGTPIAAGTVIATVDANEAGEAVNAGASINGDIYGIAELSEYGIILKRRSLQTIQYVGRESGVFYTRPEFTEVGPIARHAWAKIDGEHGQSIVFVGDSEVYRYGGGQNLTAICQRWTDQLFEELDRSRADDIVVYHNQNDTQIWIVYPSLKTSSLRVMIYNYEDDSVVIDEYEDSLGGITAIGQVLWEVAPTWSSLPDDHYWEEDTKRWYEYVEDGLRRHTIIAVGADTPAIPGQGEVSEEGVPRLLLHGRRFSRAAKDNCTPAAYVCMAETQDYDFGDASRWKYADTLVMQIEVRNKALDRPMNLYVQLGARENLDSDIRWSSPARVDVSGNGNHRTKVNIRASGRFLRIRFFSQDTNVHWRISGFSLVARAGGTF